MKRVHRYHSGDTVTIREDLKLDVEYKMLNDLTTFDDAVTEMLNFKGQTVTIKCITKEGKYEIYEDQESGIRTGYNWTDEMFIND